MSVPSDGLVYGLFWFMSVPPDRFRVRVCTCLYDCTPPERLSVRVVLFFGGNFHICVVYGLYWLINIPQDRFSARVVLVYEYTSRKRFSARVVLVPEYTSR